MSQSSSATTTRRGESIHARMALCMDAHQRTLPGDGPRAAECLISGTNPTPPSFLPQGTMLNVYGVFGTRRTAKIRGDHFALPKAAAEV